MKLYRLRDLSSSLAEILAYFAEAFGFEIVGVACTEDGVLKAIVLDWPDGIRHQVVREPPKEKQVPLEPQAQVILREALLEHFAA